ncbi:DUF4349 domain-containing protein [Neobacillus sp. MM2021_6]|uniref:DUF4349 domain-containing protein n=1 Tax=Bacillaceae TaxID=186817 RepID=UPI00140B19B3|nr:MULTISPECIES: DUF4349 domain-containing protein [Bacillaceae]MBO0962632.1 DUF4349 domain-containing protein [Neobacillus sp. MM2021_6]NHC16800.1 DUF4349 domain-containing protein [Bacillus sp. MM2020_4]
MKKGVKILPVFIFAIIVGIAGCSSSSKSEDRAKMSMENKSVMDSSQSDGGEQPALVKGDNAKANQTPPTANLEVPNQMVIYQADLQLRIRNFEQTVKRLEEKAEKYGGYIAESNASKGDKDQVSGSLKIRIPQKYFQDFLHDAEGQAAEVLQRNITGQDVTEEYVDLESRLKSKKAVEERLLAFMKATVKTEDLLKISADLAAVQEEIEVIEGRMKFLENQTSLSTITITMYENKVIIPNIDKDKLNTWEKTKQQFMKSINLLLAGLSGFVVFIIGNIPILAIFIIIGVVFIAFYKKRKNRNSQE